ncbi:YcdB/YcdC domain-containing protein [Anaeromicrobium sediminis]|uniref:YcdB/YcdC repeated domain-containing protein n=1 Tax=Anaeromicrobium sediminis TaxID=1478221 RepID=A0A267MF78_9FIRM|nr:YcdB/YcdC domain-containing protein [Anaeromicrobium sediminis]PAB57535.1 hypothetical protein CCE28_18705 [Anaeromicrobium sediminis]
MKFIETLAFIAIMVIIVLFPSSSYANEEMSMQDALDELEEFMDENFNKDIKRDYKTTISFDSENNKFEINVENENETMRFLIDDEVYNYRYRDKNDDKILPNITMEEGKEIADEFLKRNIGNRFYNLRLKDDVIIGSQLDNYVFWYKEYMNDVEVDRSFVMVYVDGNTKEITYYDKELKKYDSVDKVKKIINEDDAKKVLKDNLHMKLIKEGEDYIYIPMFGYDAHLVDAKTGEYKNLYKEIIDSEGFECGSIENIINRERATEIYFNNLELSMKYILEEENLKLAYSIKSPEKINGVDGRLIKENDREEEDVHLEEDIYLGEDVYKKELEILYLRNIIDKDYNLETSPTRGEVIKLMSKILGSRILYMGDEIEVLCTDVTRDDPYYEYVQNAIKDNIIENKEEELKLNEEINLEEIKEMILYSIESQSRAERYKEVTLNIFGKYDNKEFNNRDLAYILYNIFSK